MKYVALFLLFVLPAGTYASVVINEIMYDLDGTDSDREWIEIKNTGSDSVNLSDWKFYENSSNHGLSLYQGSEVISPGGFAVVVDSPDKFLSDWPSFSGNLFDSSWSSFSNTGETFSLKNEDGDVVSEATYTPEDGANGDGNSLQLISGEFIPASPTPGAENQTEIEENTESISSGSVEEEVETEDNILSTFGIPDRVFAGEKIKFEPELYNNEGNLLFKELFIWSLGDGSSREDDYRKDFYHTYEHPGTYVVYVEVYEGGRLKDEPDHVYRQTIQVKDASVVLATVEGGIAIKNRSIYELDLGGWDVVTDGDSFRIPNNTIVLPGKEIVFSNAVLGVDSVEEIVLQNEIDSVVASVNSPEPETTKTVTKTVYVPIQTEPDPVEKIVQDMVPETETQLASAATALPSKRSSGNAWIWIYILLVMFVIGIVGYVYFRKEDDFIDEINGAGSEADEYTFE